MKQLDPKSVWLFFFTYFLRLFFLFVFLSFQLIVMSNAGGFNSSWFSIVFLVFLFLIIFMFIWSKLTYRFYRYELTENGFRKELGVIYKKYVTIPYDRIQNVDIYRGILARILGLSDLNIQTAGASTQVPRGEGRLPGLSREEAEKLRDELIDRAKNSKNQGL
jgi:uncharacterized membrane protein YdbT with pleckstrin-like domain